MNTDPAYTETSYQFAKVYTDPALSWDYSQNMRLGCAAVEGGGYKPICEAKQFCTCGAYGHKCNGQPDGELTNDAVYLGQYSTLCARTYRHMPPWRDNYYPSGFADIADQFDGKLENIDGEMISSLGCCYRGTVYGTKATCNAASGNTVPLTYPAKGQFYLCAKVVE